MISSECSRIYRTETKADRLQISTAQTEAQARNFEKNGEIMIKIFTGALLLICSLVLSGCIYRVDVPQGNYLDQEKVEQLRAGMTREQVQFILGTPITIDPFNKNRWNYIFLIQEGWDDPVQKNLFVIFEDNALSRIEGDYTLKSGTEEPALTENEDQTAAEAAE